MYGQQEGGVVPQKRQLTAYFKALLKRFIKHAKTFWKEGCRCNEVNYQNDRLT